MPPLLLTRRCPEWMACSSWGACNLALNTMRVLIAEKMDIVCLVNARQRRVYLPLAGEIAPAAELKGAVIAALDRYRGRKEERVRIALPVHFSHSAPGEKLQLAHRVDISNSGAPGGAASTAGSWRSPECGMRGPQGAVPGGMGGRERNRPGGRRRTAVSCGRCGHLEIGSRPTGSREAVDEGAGGTARAAVPGAASLETLDYAGHCMQAKIGGDYYDFLDVGAAAEVGIVVADIAGKGIPAALLMASLQGSLHGQCSDDSKDLPRLLTSVNLHFCKHTAQARYATFFFGRYCDATRTLHYINCGHNPPLLLRKGGGVEKLGATTTVLGLFPDWKCSVAEVQLKTGDGLAIYTDGITETTGHNGEEFGEGRLLEILRKRVNLEAADRAECRKRGGTIPARRASGRFDAGDCACSIGVADQVTEPGHLLTATWLIRGRVSHLARSPFVLFRYIN